MKSSFQEKKALLVITSLMSIFSLKQYSSAERSSSSISVTAGSDTIPAIKKKSTADSFFTVYLTFDDGPVKESEELSKIALRDSVPFNLFVIGEKVFANDSMKRLFHSYFNNPFIEIGNHSFTHANKKYRQYYKNTEQVVADIILNADTLYLTNKIARLPGRNTWRINNKSRTDIEDAKAAADSLTAKEYSVFGWDLEWRYCSDSCLGAQAAALLVKEVEFLICYKKTFTKNNIIILAHDPMFGSRTNQKQLELFISAIKKKKNFRFGRLKNYPE